MIRPATIDDALRIGAIHVDGWRAAYRGIVPDSFLAGLSAERRAAGWKHAIEKDPGSVLVFETGGDVIGWSAIAASRERLPGAGEILAIYVDPLRWRQGCGRTLMEGAEQALWNRGYDRCVLWVLEQNVPARSFYRGLGYAEDGGCKSEVIEGVALAEIRLAKTRPNAAAPQNPGSRPRD